MRQLRILPGSRCSRVGPVKSSFRNIPNESALFLGGRDGRSSNNKNKQPGKLILPGQSSPPPRPQRLFVPDDADSGIRQGGAPQGGGLLEMVDEAGIAPTYNKYRPPPNFMDGILKEDVVDLEPHEMLQRLRSRSGYWHEMAKFLHILNKAGYDNLSIEVATGITPVEQSRWFVASTLLDSLRTLKMDEAVLEHFNNDGDALLYPFRFLDKERRSHAAVYVAKMNLSGEECGVLAREMKEWERRETERRGFSAHPGDCLAFKYLRDAGESKRERDIERYIQKGLSVAVTESARDRLNEFLSTTFDPTYQKAFRASLISLRLEHEEVGFRPVAVVGALGQVTARHLKNAPKASQSGPFGIFSIPPEGTSASWVTLPQWKAIAMAALPLALSVAECTALAPVLSNVNLRNTEDVKKLQGPGLLVLNMWRGKGALSEDKFYFVEDPSTGGTRMEEGGSITNKTSVIAEVLFLCRPPSRDSNLDTAELVSI